MTESETPERETPKDNRFYKTKADESKALKQAADSKRLRQIERRFRDVMRGCMRCDYEESDGVITDYCVDCRGKVTALAYRIFAEGKIS